MTAQPTTLDFSTSTNDRIQTMKKHTVTKYASLAAVAGLSLGLSGFLVYSSSSAAFESTTTNPGNSWATGSVELADDSGGDASSTGSALFSVDDLMPGDTGVRCIAIGGNTSGPTDLRMFTANIASTNGLGDELDIVVERGMNGSFDDCVGFVSDAPVYSGTLAGMSAADSWAHGLGSVDTPDGQWEYTYKFTYSFPETATSAFQDSTAAATFVWNATSRTA